MAANTLAFTGITTHLLDPLYIIEGCIVHNKNRLRLWLSLIQRKELLNKILKHGAVYRSPKDACKDNAILYIR
jgi:hypothetical protein